MFVVDGRERNKHELSALQPMDGHRVQSDTLLRSYVRSVLQIIVLTLLLVFEEETGQTTHILFTDCFVHSCASTNTLSVVVGCVRPPICFLFYVSKNHIFYRGRHASYFPGNISLPTSPSFR